MPAGAQAMFSNRAVTKQVSALATTATNLGTWLGTAQPVDAQVTGGGATPAEDGVGLKDTEGDEEEGKDTEEEAQATVAGRLCGAHVHGTAATTAAATTAATAAATTAATADRATGRATRLVNTTVVEEVVEMDEDAGEVPNEPVHSKLKPNNDNNAHNTARTSSG